MSSNLNSEQSSSYYTYLDNILIILCDIYKCPCNNCIIANTTKIHSMVSTIQEFYYFLIDCKKFIHKNKSYLKKIKELIPNMITFNNVIIQDKVCINTQIGVSAIYIENNTDNNTNTNTNNDEYYTDTTEIQFKKTKNATFTLDKLFQYYPEMRVEFM